VRERAGQAPSRRELDSDGLRHRVVQRVNPPAQPPEEHEGRSPQGSRPFAFQSPEDYGFEKLCSASVAESSLIWNGFGLSLSERT
jgi:hypothetical protein